MNYPTDPSQQNQPTYPSSYPPPPPVQRPKRRRRGCLIAIVVIVILAACGGIAAAVSSQNGASTLTDTPTATTAAQSVQTPQATTKPAQTFVTFGDGTHIVGSEIKPGTYRTRTGSAGCYYARLKGFSGAVGDILSNQNTDDVAIITIAASDKGFESSNCGTWTKDLSQITSSKTSFDDGEYFVKTDITPGTYKSSGQTGCYYARLSGFSGSLEQIISNNNTDQAAVVTISASDKGFLSTRCGHWRKI